MADGSYECDLMRIAAHHSLQNTYFSRPVCDDDWGSTQAEIICKSRGYKTGIATKESQFGPVPKNFVKFVCQGHETRLEDCLLRTQVTSCGIEVRSNTLQ